MTAAKPTAIVDQNPQLPLTCTVDGCTEARADQSPDATNRHCRTHRNEAQKRFLVSKENQRYAKAWHEGVSAMAEHVAANFTKYSGRDGNGTFIQRFSGPEIADIVRRCERPKCPELALSSEVAS